MMTAWELHWISISTKDAEIDLKFDKKPTLKQVREALVFQLTDQDFSNEIGLEFLINLEQLKELPEKRRCIKTDTATIWHLTDLLFKVEHE